MSKKHQIELEVIGGNCESVTGSCTQINTSNHTYLFELGGIQDGHTVLENYQLNSNLIKHIKPQIIDYIMITHLHFDHVGLIPALYKNNKCDAKIIVPEQSTAILKEMWLDSAFIHARDVDVLNLKGDRNYQPLYTETEVFIALEHVVEIPSHQIIDLNEELSIRYTNAGHILLSKQAEVYLKCGNHTKKILFTGDLGNVATQKSRIFVENFEPVVNCTYVIGECTYAGTRKSATYKTYLQDVNKIKAVVDQYCIDNNSRVLIPTFALDRMPYILWILYTLYGQDENFHIPIIVDSPLANRLLDCYSNILQDELKEQFDEMLNWKNIQRVITPEDSKAAVADKRAKIICASSGMLTAGRSIKWTQSILPRENDCILFIGYAGEGSLAHKIRHYKDNKTITINGKAYKNKANIVELNSFSSHMQKQDLINYYKSINCEKIYLVHGNLNDKNEFKHELQNAISECCKSTKVIATNRSTRITL